MNALERTAGDYAHRGQRIGMTIPPGVTVRVGDELHITTDAPWAWRMPACVVEVHANGVATIEPGAAVKNPHEWYCPEWNEALRQAPARELVGAVATGDQGDLFTCE